MLQLNTLELAILQEIAIFNNAKYALVVEHVSSLVVETRKIIRGGICVTFNYSKPVAPILKDNQPLEALLTGDRMIALPSLKAGLGYVLDIVEGKCCSLDIYTNSDEQWNGNYDGFEFIEKNQ
jgi:hypothetical protein